MQTRPNPTLMVRLLLIMIAVAVASAQAMATTKAQIAAAVERRDDRGLVTGLIDRAQAGDVCSAAALSILQATADKAARDLGTPKILRREQSKPQGLGKFDAIRDQDARKGCK
jgi:hypothetical protein